MFSLRAILLILAAINLAIFVNGFYNTKAQDHRRDSRKELLDNEDFYATGEEVVSNYMEFMDEEENGYPQGRRAEHYQDCPEYDSYKPHRGPGHWDDFETGWQRELEAMERQMGAFSSPGDRIPSGMGIDNGVGKYGPSDFEELLKVMASKPVCEEEKIPLPVYTYEEVKEPAGHAYAAGKAAPSGFGGTGASSSQYARAGSVPVHAYYGDVNPPTTYERPCYGEVNHSQYTPEATSQGHQPQGGAQMFGHGAAGSFQQTEATGGRAQQTIQEGTPLRVVLNGEVPVELEVETVTVGNTEYPVGGQAEQVTVQERTYETVNPQTQPPSAGQQGPRPAAPGVVSVQPIEESEAGETKNQSPAQAGQKTPAGAAAAGKNQKKNKAKKGGAAAAGNKQKKNGAAGMSVLASLVVLPLILFLL